MRAPLLARYVLQELNQIRREPDAPIGQQDLQGTVFVLAVRQERTSVSRDLRNAYLPTLFAPTTSFGFPEEVAVLAIGPNVSTRKICKV